MMRIIFIAIAVLQIPLAYGALATPGEAIVATNVKRGQYQHDAVFWGGDALANPMALEGVRWAPNSGFERIVIDLAGEGSGWETKVPPYFQVGFSSKDKKVLVSIRGISRRGLTSEKLAKSLARSPIVASTYLAPAIEGDLASFEIQLSKAAALEAFYLVSPPRIILDIRAEK